MPIKHAIIGAIILFFSAWALDAHAANRPHSRLDAVASEVAGKAVRVHCEDDADVWQGLVRQTFEPDPRSDLVAGFTAPARDNVVYVAPRICNALHDAMSTTVQDAGLAPFTLGLQILIHEAVHQSGISNEAETECRANPLVVPMTVKYFGVDEFVREKRVVNAFKTFKVRVLGKPATLRLKVPTVKYVSLKNPVLGRISQWVGYWHRAKPPAYQGGC